VTQQKTEMALYDLRRDPGERYDVQLLFPEAIIHLQKALDDMRQDIGDSLTGTIGKNVRQSGKVD
ncbi:MAG: arylsulfatase, partial [Bacteroidia bacterium]|nr:arylsulfatase [Bacteroidia bacterium]